MAITCKSLQNLTLNAELLIQNCKRDPLSEFICCFPVFNIINLLVLFPRYRPFLLFTSNLSRNTQRRLGAFISFLINRDRWISKTLNQKILANSLRSIFNLPLSALVVSGSLNCINWGSCWESICIVIEWISVSVRIMCSGAWNFKYCFTMIWLLLVFFLRCNFEIALLYIDKLEIRHSTTKNRYKNHTGISLSTFRDRQLLQD